MKDQIVMSRNNGACGVAIPLFRIQHDEELMQLYGYTVSLHNNKPIAYAIDVGAERLDFFNADWVEKNLEFIGDL